ncbi:MAG: ATP-binding cassette domain-containing protein [Verrucomicrobiota bacterium]|nr:ATP-binding cassette domain-containing protein [Verrucomicrobiota bacterium]
MDTIEAVGIEKSFGRNRVLDGVSFRIGAGETVGIVGRSGCGKSVLLKILIGLLKPEAGKVLIDGEDITRMSERELLKVRRKFGMLFQGAALFDSMTVAENVAFALRRDGKLGEAEIAGRVAEVLELVDLPGIQDKKPAELSGGMKKRVGLARAIVYRPQMVLYDEPTTGLDPIVADSIDKLIVRVCDQLEVTSIVVTHDMRSVRHVCKRVFMLHGGRVHYSAEVDEFFESRDPVVRQFVEGVADSEKKVAL